MLLVEYCSLEHLRSDAVAHLRVCKTLSLVKTTDAIAVSEEREEQLIALFPRSCKVPQRWGKENKAGPQSRILKSCRYLTHTQLVSTTPVVHIICPGPDKSIERLDKRSSQELHGGLETTEASRGQVEAGKGRPYDGASRCLVFPIKSLLGVLAPCSCSCCSGPQRMTRRHLSNLDLIPRRQLRS